MTDLVESETPGSAPVRCGRQAAVWRTKDEFVLGEGPVGLLHQEGNERTHFLDRATTMSRRPVLPLLTEPPAVLAARRTYHHSMASPTVDDATRNQYLTDGATVLRGAIDGRWLERLASAIERDIESPGPYDHSYKVGESRFHGNLRIWQNDDDFRAFCLESDAPSIARAFQPGRSA